MYARLLVESLRRGTRRKLLAVTAVCLGTLGATALAEVLLAAGDRLAAELSSYGANLEIVPGPGRETLDAARLGELRRIFWRNNIVAVAPLYPLRVRLTRMTGASAHGVAEDKDAHGGKGQVAASAGGAGGGAGGTPGGVLGSTPGGIPSGTSTVAEAVGTWFDHPLDPREPSFRSGLPRTRPTLRVAGRWPGEERAEAVLGRRLAARLGAGPGDRLLAALGGRAVELAVVGRVESGGEEDDQALVPLVVVGRLAGQPREGERFTRAEVFAQTNPESRNVRDPRSMTPAEYDAWYCTAYPSSVAFQIGQALPEARARVVHGVTGATADVLGKLRGVLIALSLVALLGAAVGVTAAMTATVLERRLEAGLMVAIGAARRRVVFFFLSEAALLGGLGGGAGGALGLAGGRWLGAGVLGVPVPWMPVLLPFAVLLGVAVALAASVTPVSRALGRYPAALLKRADA
jgi:putative ABC transport system permease protein